MRQYMNERGGVSWSLFFPISQVTMGAVTCEKGLLKLVHPGRYVEVHKSPIIAAEVMEKNPRHCITRPDVFEYPWIVVKPESLLNLGKVFFIVPNRTIYHLLKAKGSPDRLSRGTSPLKTFAGMTPKHRESIQSLERLMQSISLHEVSPREQEHGRIFRKQSELESWAEVIVKYERTSLDYEEDYATRIRFFNAKEYYSIDCNISSKFSERQDIDTELGQTKEIKHVTRLKSCLRKDDSVRKSRHLKVSFVLPNKYEELQKGERESETEFPGFSTCSLLYNYN